MNQCYGLKLCDGPREIESLGAMGIQPNVMAFDPSQTCAFDRESSSRFIDRNEN
jgi:hypothetical protein